MDWESVQMQSKRRLLTKAELAEALTISPSSVDRLRAKGLPTVHVGHRVAFDWDASLEWLQQHGYPGQGGALDA